MNIVNKLIFLSLVILSACTYEPPYAGPLWGDECLTDKGQNTISGCVHYDDGTGDSRLGLCAPPSTSTLATMPNDLRKSGYTGACRPFCDLDKITNGWTCPGDGVPTYEVHGLASGWGFCFCADTAVDAPGTPAT